MAIQSSHAQSGLNLTLKVLQFVKQLRRRLRPDPRSVDYASILGTQICASLDVGKLRQLERNRRRSGSHEGKAIRAANCVCKPQNKQKLREPLKPETRGKKHKIVRNVSEREVQK